MNAVVKPVPLELWRRGAIASVAFAMERPEIYSFQRELVRSPRDGRFDAAVLARAAYELVTNRYFRGALALAERVQAGDFLPDVTAENWLEAVKPELRQKIEAGIEIARELPARRAKP